MENVPVVPVVPVLQDSETENVSKSEYHWKVKLFFDFGSLIDLELDSFDFRYWIGILGPSPPASILGLDNVYWIWLDYCNEITKVNSSLAPCLVSFED
ncbi:unnamed protein product [Rhizophagus irregularis]|nr:unnamed protein product [Rhizophagus irregularis]